jgi:triphosphoribosyl-dephospho-CoA synthase
VHDLSLRRSLLAARDGRQRALEAALARRPEAVLVMAGTNIPGRHKRRPGCRLLLRRAMDRLGAALELEPLASGQDLLGPWQLAAVAAPAGDAKRAAMAVEAREPAGRLLDLDIYRPGGGQPRPGGEPLSRVELGEPPRPCLVCAEPARDCMALGRHRPEELLERVDTLLRGLAPALPALEPETLAAALALGARRELDLTPKPGLVDRRDNGSHPDLSHAAMAVSVDLLGLFYQDLLGSARAGRPLADAVRAGTEAERRMFQAIGSNAHRGYIFLSGLVLLAACGGAGSFETLPGRLATIAVEFFRQGEPSASHGARVRRQHGLGGIRSEAERGLPAVFEHGWPAYREALDAGWDREQADFHLMAVLMQRVEDTTAVSRCGPGALDRLRRDGARLQWLVERGKRPQAWLAGLNRAYRGWGLTMGGVADCLALVFALQAALDAALDADRRRQAT